MELHFCILSALSDLPVTHEEVTELISERLPSIIPWAPTGATALCVGTVHVCSSVHSQITLLACRCCSGMFVMLLLCFPGQRRPRFPETVSVCLVAAASLL